jgi:hypothetical protein
MGSSAMTSSGTSRQSTVAREASATGTGSNPSCRARSAVSSPRTATVTSTPLSRRLRAQLLPWLP